MGLVYLVLSALAGALFGQTYKRKVGLGFDTAQVLLWFSVSSSVLLFTTFAATGFSGISRSALWMPFAHGIAMAIAMHTYYAAIETSRLGISWTAIQLSVVIPFFTSVVVYGETLGPYGAAGIVSILGAIALYGFGRGGENGDVSSIDRRTRRRALTALLIASITTGITSALLRTFAHHHPEPEAVPLFFLLVSLTLLAINLPICFRRCARRGTPVYDVAVVRFSAYKSVVNMSAMAFLLLTVQLLPGFFVFPVRNTLNILMVFALSAVFHHERISKLEAIAVALAIAGIALLSYAME